MSTRKTTFFYAALLAVVSLAIGMVIASRLDLAPRSEAQALSAPPPMNSAPLSGPVDAGTFRGIAHDQSPMVVSISTDLDAPVRGVRRPERRAVPPLLRHAAAAARRAAGEHRRRHRLHHRQRRRADPHQQPRRRERQQDRASSSTARKATTRRPRSAGGRPRPAHRQRPHRAGREDRRREDAAGALRRLGRRCSRATGSWPSATRSATTTPSPSA